MMEVARLKGGERGVKRETLVGLARLIRELEGLVRSVGLGRAWGQHV